MIRSSPVTTARAVLMALPGTLGLSLVAGVLLSAAPAGPNSSRGLTDTDPSIDSDQDGLPDAQERLMRTRVRGADSDEDGYSDLEELARGSSPRAASSLPEPRAIDVGAVAHVRDGQVRAFFVFYSADGSFANKHLTVGAQSRGRMSQVPAEVLWRTADVRILPAREAPGRLMTVDVPLATATIHGAGSLSLFASVADIHSGQSGRVETIELLSDAETIYHRARLPREEQAVTASSGDSASGTQGMSSGQLVSTVLVPIHTENGRRVPLGNTSPSEVCLQRVAAVGVGEGGVVHEVVASECVSGWEGTCAPDCSAQVGSTFVSPDPVVYAGG